MLIVVRRSNAGAVGRSASSRSSANAMTVARLQMDASTQDQPPSDRGGLVDQLVSAIPAFRGKGVSISLQCSGPGYESFVSRERVGLMTVL
jgi:hypothetical protein